ncbi:MAG: hypothetical protein EA405_14960 [Rhodospirillales bacterium]|nr:MAG: hypothetical protein EA405_14960 [Rhodospirillales bacterium]
MVSLSSLFGSSLRPSPDVVAVTAASNALDVREFKLFGLAYAWWFGRIGLESDVERPFMRYLRTEQAPVWVRHFTREVLNRKREGRLDRRQFGLPPAPPATGSVDPIDALLRAILFALWSVAIGTVVIAVLK